MTRFGYTLMTEQSGPKELVRYAVSAERAGFDFEVSSDHYFPWLASQGHAPYAWSVLGAVAQATEQVELFTYVTCPTMRYHPAVVAQKAATLQILADGRFTLGWAAARTSTNTSSAGAGRRCRGASEMLKEAIQIIRELFTGDLIDWKGEYFEVDSARIWDVPETPGRHRHRGVRRALGRHVRAAVRPSDRRRAQQGARRSHGTTRGGLPGCPARSG